MSVLILTQPHPTPKIYLAFIGCIILYLVMPDFDAGLPNALECVMLDCLTLRSRRRNVRPHSLRCAIGFGNLGPRPILLFSAPASHTSSSALGAWLVRNAEVFFRKILSSDCFVSNLEKRRDVLVVKYEVSPAILSAAGRPFVADFAFYRDCWFFVQVSYSVVFV